MSETISNLSHEDRVFEPPADLAASANVKAEVYEQAAADRVKFWGEQADRLDKQNHDAAISLVDAAEIYFDHREELKRMAEPKGRDELRCGGHGFSRAP